MGRITMGTARAGTASLPRIFLSRKNTADKKTVSLAKKATDEDILLKILECAEKETVKFANSDSVKHHKPEEINKKLIFLLEHSSELKIAIETLKKEKKLILPKDIEKIYEEIDRFNQSLADAFGEGVALWREKIARREIL
ncbi:MAG: hypothetical protein ABH841_02005 [Candidatus Nealsonbacteria bacterium]